MNVCKDISNAASLESEPRAGAARVALWTVRIAFCAVFLVNVQCAASFILWPGSFAGAYELSGVAGEAAVRGMGVTFLMWNATYPLVIWRPSRYRALAGVVVAQQAIGLFGESLVLATLPAGHDALAASILRFIVFDGAGLVLMAAALAWLCVTMGRVRRGAEKGNGA